MAELRVSASTRTASSSSSARRLTLQPRQSVHFVVFSIAKFSGRKFEFGLALAQCTNAISFNKFRSITLPCPFGDITISPI